MSLASGPPPIIDTHTHLDDPAFDADRADVLSAARACGVRRIVNIGYKPERWESSRALCQSHPDIAIALGLHPAEASTFTHELERDLRRSVEALRPVAVGETGFDFAHLTPMRAEQERAFRAQLAIAQEFGLPVVIHQRNAADALVSELNRWPDLAPIVLHSFDGNRRHTDWAIERRCYFGVGGLACKPSSGSLRDLLKDVPLDRLLLETDAPYLSPPGTGSRRNTPANLRLIADSLAPLWGLESEELCRVTTLNADRVFGFGLAVDPSD